MNHMSAMTSSGSGDTKVWWEPSDPASVEVAAQVFARYRTMGYRAFRMTGTNGEQMVEFDPSVRAILLIPQMQGG